MCLIYDLAMYLSACLSQHHPVLDPWQEAPETTRQQGHSGTDYQKTSQELKLTGE